MDKDFLAHSLVVFVFARTQPIGLLHGDCHTVLVVAALRNLLQSVVVQVVTPVNVGKPVGSENTKATLTQIARLPR